MYRLIVATIVLFEILVLMPGVGRGIYICQDAEGRQVLTDRPAQLKGCALMDISTPSGSGRSVAPSNPSAQPPVQNQPTEPSQKSRPSSPGGLMSIPIQRVGSLFLVTVHLSGESGEADARLIVDTGASHTIVSHSLAVNLGLYSDTQSGSVMMSTVGGPVQVPLARIKSIRIGEADVANSLAVIHDLPESPTGAEGLLGLSALQHFQVTLDPNKGLLWLQPSAK